MNDNQTHKKIIRLFIAMIGLFVFVMQPLMETTHLLLDWDHEISQIDFDQDVDEKEKQEKEVAEKDLIQHREFCLARVCYIFDALVSYGEQKSYVNFVTEIPIPPPRIIGDFT